MKKYWKSVELQKDLPITEMGSFPTTHPEGELKIQTQLSDKQEARTNYENVNEPEKQKNEED